MKTLLKMIISLLAITVFTGLTSAMEPEVLYKDEKVVMEKIGQMRIDAYNVCWRADEVPNAELGKLSDKAVVIENSSTTGNSVVLYPYLIYDTNEDYSKTSAKFYDYKGTLLNEVPNLVLPSWDNFTLGEAMFKLFPDKNEGLVYIFDYRGKELSKFKILGVLDASYDYLSPENKIVFYDETAGWFDIYSFSGMKKRIEVEAVSDGRMASSKNGNRIGWFTRNIIIMYDGDGIKLWSTKVNFGGYIGQAYISSNTQYVMAYYISDDTHAQSIVLLNPKGQIVDRQVVPSLGYCSFYESVNGNNIGVGFSADENIVIIAHQLNKGVTSKIILKIPRANRTFSFSAPPWPIMSTEDGKQIYMVSPHRASGNQKDVIRITLLK